MVSALLTGVSLALALPSTSRARLERVVARAPDGDASRRGSRVSPAVVAALSAAVGSAVLVGGLLGLVVGAVAGVIVLRVVSRLEPADVRRRRAELEAALPGAVDLVGACLSVGRPPGLSVQAVARAVGGPLGAELEVIASRLALGADPVTVWHESAWVEPLAPLCRTMARSIETGAPMAEGLHRLADDLRRRERANAEQRAASVGVRAAAPLGLCFLPAFLLIGIVPTIVGAFSAMSWG
ncbi:MAG: type II secretion system F family protein [Propionibacteriales bacterium]|nr:type II secretion system F family protein [Propionibacteriales bacterium]